MRSTMTRRPGRGGRPHSTDWRVQRPMSTTLADGAAGEASVIRRCGEADIAADRRSVWPSGSGRWAPPRRSANACRLAAVANPPIRR